MTLSKQSFRGSHIDCRKQQYFYIHLIPRCSKKSIINTQMEPDKQEAGSETIEEVKQSAPDKAESIVPKQEVVAILRIKGAEFGLNEEEMKCFTVFSEEQAIKQENCVIARSDEIEPQVVAKMLKLLKRVNYTFKEYAPIRTDKLEEVIDESVAPYFSKLTLKELNKMYVASRQLGCEGMRRYLVASLACRVFFTPTLNDYNRKRDQLGIKKDLTQTILGDLRHKYRELLE